MSRILDSSNSDEEGVVEQVSLMDAHAQNAAFEDDIEVTIRQPGQDSARSRVDPESGEVVPRHRQGRRNQHRQTGDGPVPVDGEEGVRVRQGYCCLFCIFVLRTE